jgi:hypothetical protein
MYQLLHLETGLRQRRRWRHERQCREEDEMSKTWSVYFKRYSCKNITSE